MENINLHPNHGSRQSKNVSSETLHKLETLFKTVSNSGKKFPQHLTHSIQGLLQSFSSKGLAEQTQSSIKLLDSLSEFDPAHLEHFIEDLTPAKKKVHHTTISDILALNSSYLGTMISGSNDILVAQTDSTKISTLLSTPRSAAKQLSQMPFGFKKEELNKAMETSGNVVNAIVSCCKTAAVKASLNTSSIKDSIHSKPPEEWVLEDLIALSRAMDTEVSAGPDTPDEPMVITAARHIQHNTLSTFVQKSSLSTSSKITDIINKPSHQWTLGDLNALAVYAKDFESQHDGAVDISTLLHSMQVLQPMVILSDNRHGSLSHHLFANRLIKLIADFSPEEIKAMIEQLLKDGIQSDDELETILRLLGELGMSSSIGLVRQVTEAIETYMSTTMNQTSDPLAVIKLVKMIQELAPLDLSQQLDLSKLNNPLQDLLSQSGQADSQLAPQAFGLSIQPMSPQNQSNADTSNLSPLQEPTQAAETKAGLSMAKKNTHHSLQTVDQKILSPLSLSKIETAKETVDLLHKDPKRLSKTSDEAKEWMEEFETLLNAINTLLQDRGSSFHNSIIDLLESSLKPHLDSKLDHTLDDTLDILAGNK